MRIKIDESLPTSLGPILRAMGHDVQTVYDEKIAGRDDSVVWRAAQEERRFVLAQDLGFAARALSAPHAGLLLLRLRFPPRVAIEERIRQVFALEAAESWAGCLVAVTDVKIRVRGAAG